jgi:DNA-binding transcriptional regulator YiaG
MRKKKSAILEAVHETATGLHKAGIIDRVTLREFEIMYLQAFSGYFRRTSPRFSGNRRKVSV